MHLHIKWKYLFGLLLIVISIDNVEAQTKFIENLGQWPSHVLFRAETPTGHVYLEKTGITYNLWDKEIIKEIHEGSAKKDYIQFHSVKMQLVGSNAEPNITSEIPYEELYNFYLGNDPNKWASAAKAYQIITYKDIYPNIDLKIEATGNAFKYSFIAKPFANLKNIKWKISGANDILIKNLQLIIKTELTDIIEEQPYCYQHINNEKTEVKSQFTLDGDIVRISTLGYDESKEITLDPSVIFSSLSNSTADNWGYTATYDEDGNAYTGGTVYESDYPTTIGAYQRFWKGGDGALARDCAFYKLNANGTQLQYATFFGGSSNEQPHSMVVNSQNELIVLGTTLSSNLPTLNPAQASNRGAWEMFVTVFNSNGSKLIGSTYLGGTSNDGINGAYKSENGPYKNTNELVYNYGDLYRGEVIVDKDDNIYIASTSTSLNFPITNNAYQKFNRGGQDAVVCKLSPTSSKIIWSTYVGGTYQDAAYSLDIEDSGDVFVTGGTKGGSFPTSSNAYQKSFKGGMADAFVIELAADGSSLLNSTIIGTTEYDQSYFLKIGPNGFPWIFGQTEGAFPTKNTSNNKKMGMFITQLNKDLSGLVKSKIIGSGDIVNISPSAFTVDKCGRVYLSGWGELGPGTGTGNTTGLDITNDAAQKTTDGRDFYIAVYTTDLKDLIYGTFWGGNSNRGEHVDGGTSRFDKRGVMYQAICAACGTGSGSNPYPTYPNAVYGPLSRHNNTTNCNNAVVKIDLEGSAIFSEFEHSEITCSVPQKVDFTNFTQDATSFTWKMGDGKTYTDSNVSHTYTKPGNYKVQLISYNPISCNLRDTFELSIDIYSKADAEFTADIDYCEKTVQFERTGDYGQNYKWDFGDGNISRETDPSHKFLREGKYTVLLIADENTECVDSFSVNIELEDPVNSFDLKLDSCSKTLEAINTSKGSQNNLWDFGDGNQSTDYSTQHNYTSRGSYTVSMTTNKGLSCEETKFDTIKIIDPEAQFSYNIDTCNFTVSLNNTSIDAKSFEWDFGNNTRSSLDNPVVTYADGDSSYKIILIAAPYSACADSSVQIVNIPNLPVALFNTTNDSCLSAAQFTNLSINSPNYLWYFGNGDSSFQTNPYYNYRDTGVFKVSLIAYPFQSCSDTFSLEVQIDTFRYADFELSLDTCNFKIQIINKSEDLDIFTWDFGNGNNQIGENPNYTYDKDGNYNLSMLGKKSINGCMDSFQYALYIPPLPKAGYVYQLDSCFNTYIFSDTSSFAKNRIWLGPNKEQSIDSSFKINFNKIGNYEVKMIVQSQYSCFDTLDIPVQIDSIPTADFDILIDSCIGALQLNDSSMGRFKSEWDFGNNSRSNEKNPYISYSYEGNYIVSLIINKGSECENEIQKEVEITQYLTNEITIPNVFSPNGDGINDVFELQNLRNDCDDYELYIYNRWGVLVHSSKGNKLTWDGTNNKELFLKNKTPLAQGVYYYIFKSKTYKQEGTIELLK